MSARGLFADRGYAETSIEDIVTRAGVTKGAPYHNFDDKEHVFTAVFERLGHELVGEVATAFSSELTPWEQCVAGCRAFLDAARDPAVQRVMLLDAPSVLGWERWRAIDEQYGFFGLLRVGLQAAMDIGVIVRQPAEPLAHMLLGALHEAAMLGARTPDARRSRQEVRDNFLRLLEGLVLRSAAPARSP